MLTPEGARVQHDWLYSFIRGPITIRPWLDVRMPTFGLDDQNINSVINYFGSVSNKMAPFQTNEVLTNASLTDGGAGKQLFDATCPLVRRVHDAALAQHGPSRVHRYSFVNVRAAVGGSAVPAHDGGVHNETGGAPGNDAPDAGGVQP